MKLVLLIVVIQNKLTHLERNKHLKHSKENLLIKLNPLRNIIILKIKICYLMNLRKKLLLCLLLQLKMMKKLILIINMWELIVDKNWPIKIIMKLRMNFIQ